MTCLAVSLLIFGSLVNKDMDIVDRLMDIEYDGK